MARFSRSVEPEWLDELPPLDARAVRARRELRRINALMGNARLLAAHLTAHLTGVRVADLGGGDGSLMRAVARRQRRALDITVIDRLAGRDAFEFLRQPGAGFDAIVANLFLHHFEDERLAELLSLAAARAPVFIACEPSRSRLALGASRLLGLLGCGAVTRHDALASVRAGFRGRELSGLWPPGWQLLEEPAGLFSHLFVARRHA